MRLHPTAGSRGGGPRAAPHGRLRGAGPRTAPHGRLPASFCALRGHSVERATCTDKNQEQDSHPRTRRRGRKRILQAMQRSSGRTNARTNREVDGSHRIDRCAERVLAASSSCSRAALALHHGGPPASAPTAPPQRNIDHHELFTNFQHKTNRGQRIDRIEHTTHLI